MLCSTVQRVLTCSSDKAPEATAEAFDGDWLKTGDLAYLVDGELVVCGRLKDVIIVGGRNVFPEDVERAVASVDGVRAGNVIAFGVAGRRGKDHGHRGRRPGPTIPSRFARRWWHGCSMPSACLPRTWCWFPREPAQDLIGQAPALAVSGPLPGGHAHAGLAQGSAGPREPTWRNVGAAMQC